MANPIKKISVESQTIVSRLVKAEIGETVSYDELSSLIGLDVRKHRGYVTTALRRALSDHGIVFRAIPNEGYLRCSDEQKVELMASQSRRSRNAAKKGIKIGSAVEEFEKLPHAQQIQHNLEMSRLGVTAFLTETKARKAIEREVGKVGSQTVIPPLKVLEAFKGS